MNSLPELRSRAQRAPQALQEFFAKDVTAALLGVVSLLAGIFVRHLEHSSKLAEYKDGIGALCDALVIAAILKLFVDPILKREAAKENAKDVFRYAFGYTLPDKLKQFVQDLVLETRTVRRKCQLHWDIKQKANDPQRVEVILTVTFVVINFTSKPLRYRHEVYSWKDNEQDVGCVRSIFFDPNGSLNRAYKQFDETGLKSDRDGLIRGKNVMLTPNAPETHNNFGVIYYAETDRVGIDQFSIREPTMEIDVFVVVDDQLAELDFSVNPNPLRSRTDDYRVSLRDPKTNRLGTGWQLNKVFVANENVVLRWKKREVKTISSAYVPLG